MIRNSKSIRHSSVRVWFNSTLVVGSGIVFFLFSIPVIRRMAELTNDFQEKMPLGNAICFWLAGICSIVMWVGILYAVAVYAEFSESGIRIGNFFKKYTEKPYKHYPYVQKAWYDYYGMSIYYIVLSNRRLTTAEQMSINNVKNSSDMIKLRYNKRSFETLQKVLPKEMAATLRAEFRGIPARRITFI